MRNSYAPLLIFDLAFDFLLWEPKSSHYLLSIPCTIHPEARHVKGTLLVKCFISPGVIWVLFIHIYIQHTSRYGTCGRSTPQKMRLFFCGIVKENITTKVSKDNTVEWHIVCLTFSAQWSRLRHRTSSPVSSCYLLETSVGTVGMIQIALRNIFLLFLFVTLYLLSASLLR